MWHGFDAYNQSNKLGADRKACISLIRHQDNGHSRKKKIELDMLSPSMK